MKTISRGIAAVAVLGVTVLFGVGPAVAAKRHHRARHRTHARHHVHRNQSSSSGNGETPLTGSTLDSASSAAVAANPGATVDSASTETDSSISGAAYEVHITQPDSSHAVVIEDSSFNVLATQADEHGGGWGH